MESELHIGPTPPSPSSSSDALPGPLDEGLRAKTSLRLHYEAQVEVIRRQIGGLEGARQALGLSQRKMSQLLLVDPSAWTRWVKTGEKAPPHIFRALQWYLALHEKIPGLTNEYFLGPSTSEVHEAQRSLSRGLERSQVSQLGLEGRVHELERSLRHLRHLNWGLGLLSLGFALILLILVSKQMFIH